jgi:hypothetical protein
LLFLGKKKATAEPTNNGTTTPPGNNPYTPPAQQANDNDTYNANTAEQPGNSFSDSAISFITFPQTKIVTPGSSGSIDFKYKGKVNQVIWQYAVYDKLKSIENQAWGSVALKPEYFNAQSSLLNFKNASSWLNNVILRAVIKGDTMTVASPQFMIRTTNVSGIGKAFL